MPNQPINPMPRHSSAGRRFVSPGAGLSRRAPVIGDGEASGNHHADLILLPWRLRDFGIRALIQRSSLSRYKCNQFIRQWLEAEGELRSVGSCWMGDWREIRNGVPIPSSMGYLSPT